MTPDTAAPASEPAHRRAINAGAVIASPAMGNVTPLPRPRGEHLQDRINLALSILGHRGWCPRCLPDARQVAEALTGVSLEELAARPAPETEG